MSCKSGGAEPWLKLTADITTVMKVTNNQLADFVFDLIIGRICMVELAKKLSGVSESLTILIYHAGRRIALTFFIRPLPVSKYGAYL